MKKTKPTNAAEAASNIRSLLDAFRAGKRETESLSAIIRDEGIELRAFIVAHNFAYDDTGELLEDMVQRARHPADLPARWEAYSERLAALRKATDEDRQREAALSAAIVEAAEQRTEELRAILAAKTREIGAVIRPFCDDEAESLEVAAKLPKPSALRRRLEAWCLTLPQVLYVSNLLNELDAEAAA